LFKSYFFNEKKRAAIATTLIVVLTSQLYLLPNLSKFSFTTDSDPTYENLKKCDPYDGNPGDITDFINPEVPDISIPRHLQETRIDASLVFLKYTTSHSIRSPPTTLPNQD